MSNENYIIEECETGWRFVMKGRNSPTFATREQAILAANAEVETRDSVNEEELETGLEDTFPASDPVSATNPSHTGGPDREKEDTSKE